MARLSSRLTYRALTGPALFKALRDAGTKAYEAGLTALY